MKLFCDHCNKTQETTSLHCVTKTTADWMCKLSLDEACEKKFQIGRAEHGPVFLRNPIEEIDMELIDGVNYAREAIRQGYDAQALEIIISKLKEVDNMVRQLYNASETIAHVRFH